MFYRNQLRYNFNSLEPYIDEETMYEHFNEHFRKYTDELNKIVSDNALQNESVETLLALSLENTSLRNNLGGFLNHNIYFENISPYSYENNYELLPASFQMQVKEKFGGYSMLVKMLKDAGKSVFGSGWVWLIYDFEQYGGVPLKIITTKNQDNPLMFLPKCNILLGIDVWEHAYYLKYKSKRSEYLDNIFNIINWSEVNKRIYGMDI